MDAKVLAEAMVLGDGYLEPHGRETRLCIRHSVRFADYVEWKRGILRAFRPSPASLSKGRYPFLHFKTAPHPWFTELRESYYRNGRKVVPVGIDRVLADPAALAVWAMDDGTVDRRQGSFLFEVQCFDGASMARLRRCLERCHGIGSRTVRSDKGRGGRLYVTVTESRRLGAIIAPFIVESLRYKLPIPL